MGHSDWTPPSSPAFRPGRHSPGHFGEPQVHNSYNRTYVRLLQATCDAAAVNPTAQRSQRSSMLRGMESREATQVCADALLKGRRTVCLACPEHDDQRPSLLVVLETGMAHCLAGCREGRWYPLRAFYPEAKMTMGAGSKGSGGVQCRPHVPSSSRRGQELLAVLHYLVDTEEALRTAGGHTRLEGEVGNWLSSRGLVPARVAHWVFRFDRALEDRLVARFGMEYLQQGGLFGPSGRPLAGAGRRALLVGRGVDGNPVGVQVASTSDRAREKAKYLSPGGASPAPFGLDTVSGRSCIVVTEGIVDALSVLQDGLWRGEKQVLFPDSERVGVVGICGVGVPVAPTLKQVLKLAPKASFVVATDPDPAGEQAAVRIRDLLIRVGGRRVLRWRGEDDVNECMRRRLLASA